MLCWPHSQLFAVCVWVGEGCLWWWGRVLSLDKVCFCCCCCCHLQARSTKAKARVDAFAELQTKAKDVPVADLKVDFGRVAMTRLGNKAVILNNITHGTPTGRVLLKDFSFEFLPGKRIGVAGEFATAVKQWSLKIFGAADCLKS